MLASASSTGESSDGTRPTLEEWLRHRSLGASAFLDLAIAIAEDVKRVHDRGALRRDISPASVRMDTNGRPKLAAAPAIDATPGTDGSRLLAYTAPEETGRMDRTVDRRTDLYALGATFYRMLTGTPPFCSEDPVELVHAHVARKPVTPCAVNPAVPPAVSDIVLKLLAKMPEDRYQTADSLLVDLEEARRRLAATGAVEPFELGLRDLQEQMPAPDRLYGRDYEMSVVRDAFEEACTSGARVVLVSGRAGVGKSALVHALQAHAKERGGRFVEGRAELGGGNAPYAPFVGAFRELILGLVEEPPNDRATTSDRLLHALGANAQVITDLVPEFERLVGAQPPLPELGPVQTHNRFALSVAAFLSAVASREHPLVLFVDDLQRADPSSLRLFRFLAGANELGPVLLAGAMRPVASTHPVTEVLGAVRSAPATGRVVELGPLDGRSVQAICCASLRCTGERGAPLAEVVRRKTAGNPFFVLRFLRYLPQRGLAWWNAEERRWDWDLPRIEQVAVTDNVVDLLLHTLRRLPATTRDVLQAAACIGDTFPVRLLAELGQEPVEITAGKLWAAVREGFVEPVVAPQQAFVSGPRYRFAHDRVQQAVYSLLGEEQRAAHHLQIGRALIERMAGEERTAVLFRAVDQLNAGARLLSDEAERLELVGLNVRAGGRARSSSAYSPALGYFQHAMSLLPPNAWESLHDLAFLLHRSAAECAYLAGESGLGGELLEVATRNAGSRLERATLCNVRIVACTLRVDYPAAIRWGREALRLFDLDVPERGIHDAVLEEVRAALAALGGRPVEELLQAPEMRSPEHLALVQILANLFAPTYIARPDLYPFVVTRMVHLGQSYGHTGESSFAYAAYGVILASMTDDYVNGHAFGRLGVELSRRFGNPVHQCRTLGVFGAFMNHWREPMVTSMPLLREAIDRGARSGELQYSNYWGLSVVKNLFHRGVELAQVLAETERFLSRARKEGVPAGVVWQLPYRQAIRCLQGRTKGRSDYEDAEFDERAFLESVSDDPLGTGLYDILRLETSFLFGDHRLAVEMSDRAREHLASQRGSPTVLEHNFYTSLAKAALCESATDEQRKATLAEMEEAQRQLELWALNCPENFRHKWLLVEAERARLQGRPLDAAALYDEAIDGARQRQFVQDEAIAGEAAGRFYRAAGRARIAQLYLSSAARGYARWGATAKVRALQEEFPDLALATYRGPETEPHAGASLDLQTILRGAEAIASEVVLDRVLAKLLEVCLANAGAERGLLFLEDGNHFALQAGAAVTGPATVEVLPVGSIVDLPAGPVEHVRTTGETLVLADALRHGGFLSDPYVVRRSVRSLMALPIRRKTRLVGALYLENTLATNVFSPERVRVLQLLSSQMAISLEVGQLVEKLTREIEERKRAEALAHDAVRFRDDFLAAASHELRTPLTSLRLDIQGLLRERAGSGTTALERLALADRQVERLGTLVDQLLDVTWIRQGREALTIEPFDIAVEVRRAVERMQGQTERSGSVVTVHGNGPMLGRWDRARIGQLMTTLLSNALTFGEGRPVDVTVEQSPASGWVRILVRDRGVGIGRERLEQILEAFHRATSVRRYGGFSLGLFVAGRIVDAHGGRISIESEPGSGACVTVDLPPG
jgi:predicted ATPase/signal transduction histidine kinase